MLFLPLEAAVKEAYLDYNMCMDAANLEWDRQKLAASKEFQRRYLEIDTWYSFVRQDLNDILDFELANFGHSRI